MEEDLTTLCEHKEKYYKLLTSFGVLDVLFPFLNLQEFILFQGANKFCYNNIVTNIVQLSSIRIVLKNMQQPF